MSNTDGCLMFPKGYARSPFRDIESYLRNLIGLDQRNFLMILKQNNSNFNTYERPPGIFTSNVFSEVVYTMCDHGVTIQIDYDDISMKTKFILTRFGLIVGTLSFKEKSFLLHYCVWHHIWIRNLLMLFMLIPQAYTLVKTS